MQPALKPTVCHVGFTRSGVKHVFLTAVPLYISILAREFLAALNRAESVTSGCWSDVNVCFKLFF